MADAGKAAYRVNGIGFAIVCKVQIEIGGNEIDTLYPEWMHTRTTRPRPPGRHSSISKTHRCTPMAPTNPRIANSSATSSPRSQAATNTRTNTDPAHPSSAPAPAPPVEISSSAPEPAPLPEAPAPPSPSMSGSAAPASPNRDEEVADPTGRSLISALRSDAGCPQIECRLPSDRMQGSPVYVAGPTERSSRLPDRSGYTRRVDETKLGFVRGSA